MPSLTAPGSPPPLPALTPDQLREVSEAKVRMKLIRRAVNTATFDGWTIAICGGLTLLTGYTSLTGMLLGAVLCVIAFIELRFAPRLGNLDPRAARTLGQNQLVLAAMLILYAVWSLVFPAPLSAEIVGSAGDLQTLGIDLEQVNMLLNRLTYVALILIALAAQGSLAVFYFRREKMIREYVAKTPEWVIQMQRAGFGL